MRVLIIGAGNIGRRHAQNIIHNHHVDIVEPKRKARKIAEKMLGKEILPHHYGLGTYDVAIIATCANERREAYEIAKLRAKYIILEKFLFNNEKEYNLKGNNIYVNFPRRMMNHYSQSKTHNTIIYMGFENLLSNAIHFADLLEWYERKPTKITFRIKKKIKSKRKGYYEAKGSVIIMCGESVGYLTTEGNRKHIMNEILVDEYSERFEMQSELTPILLNDIDKGQIRLTPYEESERLHLEYLRALKSEGWRWPIT